MEFFPSEKVGTLVHIVVTSAFYCRGISAVKIRMLIVLIDPLHPHQDVEIMFKLSCWSTRQSFLFRITLAKHYRSLMSLLSQFCKFSNMSKLPICLWNSVKKIGLATKKKDHVLLFGRTTSKLF